MKHGQLYRIAFEFIGLCACIFLTVSVLSFNMGDAPSGYVWPHNQPVQNLCGRAGAFCAYYSLYYFGPGVLLAWVSFGTALLIHLSGKPVTQPLLRLIGLALTVATISTAWNLLWPTQTMALYRTGAFPMGNGGILGAAAASYLNTQMALLGTWLVVVCCWTVGALLLADSVVFASVRWFGMGVLKTFGMAEPAWNAAREHSVVLGDIWKRLSEKQKSAAKDFTEAVRNYTKQLHQNPLEQAQTGIETETSVATIEPESTADALEAAQESSLEQTLENRHEAAQSESKPIIHKAKPAPKPKETATESESCDAYQLPPMDFLKEPEAGFSAIQTKMVEHKAQDLEALLEEFGVNAKVVNAEPGPAITMYELELAAGVKVNQISNLANDMARALSSGMVRVVAPLAGKHTIGIEVPNSQRETVRLKELLLKGEAARMQIPLYLGKSSSGEVLVSDLAAMPHLLIAGTTGSGKSVCINSIITSVMLTRRPDEVKLILIDPKMVEMAMFESIPHLMCPTVTEMRRAEQILEWATTKMDERYELLAEAQVRNLASYNLLTQEELIERFKPSTPEEEAMIPKKMPHIVIIIDELADLMMTSAKEIEAYIVRIAQKSRAVGIHLVLATQRPQATVVTGLIKSNMPSRIAFRVAARMDSRIILDQNGAETLLGQGDMLFLKPGTSELMRAQGAYLDDEEIRGVVKYLKGVAQQQFSPELMQLNTVDLSGMKQDDMFDEAVKVVLESQRGSVSLLQRRLSIGYARASRIIEMMAASGILGEYKGSQAREVVMTLEEYEAMKKNMIQDQVAGYADLTQNSENYNTESYDEEEDLTEQEEQVDTR
ncbi:MAG: DNA translocase FtsK [Planctomycetaceae bacterium]|nr:DNA translocase FtsK [Planctomycetaceae bacterium]